MDKETQVRALEKMLTIRRFEEKAIEAFSEGFIPGILHTYVGEEAVAAGVAVNLRDDDYVAGTHRGHGHCLAKGMDPQKMMAELMGKKTGSNGGKGGSMHTVDFAKGILGSNGIVASGMPIIVGAGLSIRMRKTDQVAVAFFGDGASNRGAFHESLNMASAWNLPVVFVCEDNGWAISVAKSRSTRVKNLADRAAGYGIPGITVDGTDVVAVATAAGEAVERARKGGGPTLLVCNTCRMRGHEEGDNQEYRPKEDIARARASDPIEKLVKRLTKDGILTEAEFKAIDSRITEQMEDAVQFGKDSPEPAPEDAVKDVFAEVI